MNEKLFISKLKDILDNYKTVYMWGVFGAPVTEKLIESKTVQYPSWYTPQKVAELKALVGKGYFAFDCVCLIKAILWGWNGDLETGGAKYTSNGVPDTSANGMIGKCTGVSNNFAKIVPGAAVGMDGHIGIYIGHGEVIECTPKWDNCVQISYLENIGATGKKSRKWTSWGKLPYIHYTTDDNIVEEEQVSAYAKSAWEKAKALGINDGKNPKGIVTEEQLMKFFENLGLLEDKK